MQLAARTSSGARLVALAEALALEIAPFAAAHDRDGSYPHASADRLAAAGYYAAPIPADLGGMGADSLHDVVVASSRLARADASLAIGVNMHMAALANMARMYRDGAEKLAPALERIAHEGVRLAAAVSEPGQDLTRPGTTATRTADGWEISGRKLFCTGSPAATVLYTSVSFVGEDGGERYGYAMVPADAEGVTVHDDWDALGMRASGSHSVTFDGVRLPKPAVSGGFPAGNAVPYMERNLAAGLFHASASLGIAEGAAKAALGGVAARGATDGRTRALAADNAMDLTLARATLARGAALIDEHEAAHPGAAGDPEAITALFVEAQAVKTVVGEASGRVVERSLAMTGGGGFLNGHPIARAYRDVRAGTFMNPLAANRAYEVVGMAALGLDPSLS